MSRLLEQVSQLESFGSMRNWIAVTVQQTGSYVITLSQPPSGARFFTKNLNHIIWIK